MMIRIQNPFAMTAIAAAVLFAAPAAQAEIMTFTAELTGTASVPPNDSAATGTIEVICDTEAKTVTWLYSHEGLSGDMTPGQIFKLTSFTEKALSSCSQAGMVNNLNDGLAWGLFPLYFAAAGLSVGRIGVLAALYPAVWGLGQLVTGGLSDRIGRKWLIAGGMFTQAFAIAVIAATSGFWIWAASAMLLGAGTAMVYPTLLAAIGDVAHPSWRARSVGVYRLWRDGGFAVGALIAGIIADLVSLTAAISTVAAITAASGLVVAIRMYETHPRGLSPAPVITDAVDVES